MPDSTLNSTAEPQSHDALSWVPYGHKAKNLIEHGFKSSPGKNYGDDYRREIYHGASSAVAEDGERMSGYFKWVKDGIYGWHDDTIHGRKGSIPEETHKKYVSTLSSK